MDAALHKYPVGTNAGLSTVAELARHQAGHREIEIRVVEYDKRGVAPQFEAQSLTRGGAPLRKKPPHRRRAGEGQLAYARMGSELRAHVLRHAGDDGEGAAG